MMENAEYKMKLVNVPFIRMWTNLFNYHSKEKRKEYYIDLLLLIVSVILINLTIDLLIKYLN